MNGARATLIVANQRALGWLTDQHPDAPGEVVLILDANLSRPFRASDGTGSFHRVARLA